MLKETGQGYQRFLLYSEWGGRARSGEKRGGGMGGWEEAIEVPLSGSCDIIPGRAGCFPEGPHQGLC